MASLEALLEQLPEARRRRAAEFLEAQHLKRPEDLRALLPDELEQALAAAADLTIGQRMAIRSLRAGACREPGRPAAADWASRRLPRRCLTCLVILAKSAALCALGVYCQAHNVWASFTSQHDRCHHPVRSQGDAGNITSGVKVLVFGFRHTGARTLSRALFELGMKHSYDSEDLNVFAWANLVDDFWSDVGRSYASESWPDLSVLNETAPGHLAAALAKCRVDAVAFDGVERLFWPVYQTSPDAKVISLNWRSLEEQAGFMSKFGWQRQVADALASILTSPQHLLPWSILLQPVSLLFFKYDLTERLREGGQPIAQVVDPLAGLFHNSLYYPRVRRRRTEGLAVRPNSKSYHGLYASVRKTVPADRLLEWDMLEHRWEDLCGFLEIKKCPKRGPLVTGVDAATVDYDFRLYFLAALPVWFFLHWLNLLLLGRVLGLAVRIVVTTLSWAWAALAGTSRRIWSTLSSLKGGFFPRLFLVLIVSISMDITEFWTNTTDSGIRCEHPALPGNQSGVKVLVAGLAKTGTRTLARSLYEIGLPHTYHSEEFNFHVWSHIYHDYWDKQKLKAQNVTSAMVENYTRPNVTTIAMNLFGPQALLEAATPERLARKLSECRTDAVLLDGMEALFWPVYHVSPDVKVISMHWRSWEEYEKSHSFFVPALGVALIGVGLIIASIHLLPWPLVLFMLDPLAGRPVERMMKEGGPPLCQDYSFFTALYHTTINSRRILSHWSSGLGYDPKHQEDYDAVFEAVRRVVPKERFMEWDMKKHTWEDLCNFVGVKECARTGRLPRAINLLNFERDFPVCWWGRVPLYLLLHRINWALFWGAVSAMSSAVARLADLVRKRMRRDKPSGEAE